MSNIDFRRLIPTEKMSGETTEDTKLLRAMLHKAEEFMRSYKWCPEISQRYLGFGVGGIVAVFLFRFREKIANTDDLLWVIVGDLPSAYVVVDRAPDARAALAIYCDLMAAWAGAILQHTPLDAVFPVKAEATEQNARQMESRIDFLKTEIIPTL